MCLGVIGRPYPLTMAVVFCEHHLTSLWVSLTILQKKRDRSKQRGNQGLRPAPVLRLIDIEFSGEESDLCSEESHTHPVCKGNLADTNSPCLPPGILVEHHTAKARGTNSALQLSVCKLSMIASSNLVKSSYSFCTEMLLPPLQPLNHACGWQRLEDDGHKTAVCPCLDSDFQKQTQITTLNILPDLLLHIQACYIL